MTAILGALGAYGATAVAAVVSITDQDIFEAGTGSVSATYSVANDGKVKNGAGAILETWLQGSGGVVANYEVRATLVSGTLTSGTTGSWLGCATTRTWTKTNGASNNSTVTAALTIEIRRASDGIVLDSATVTLSAESDNFS